MPPISPFSVKIAKYLDYVPFISTITNIVFLVAKAVLSIFRRLNASAYARVEEQPFLNYLVNQKKASECLLLAFPWANIFIAAIRDCCAEEIRIENAKELRGFIRNSPEPSQSAPVASANDFRPAAQQIEQKAKTYRARREEAKKEIRLELAESRDKEEEKLQKVISNIDKKMAECPDDEAGRKSRKSLEEFKERLIKLHHSRHDSLLEIANSFGL